MKNIELYDRIEEVTQGQKYKKVDERIILDEELSVNDKAVYLAILFGTSFDGKPQEIGHKRITKITGIAQNNQHMSIKRLESKLYINVSSGEYGYAYTENRPKNFLKLPLKAFECIAGDRRNYILRLMYIMLSDGNDQLPTFKTCKEKLPKLNRQKYRQLKSLEIDLDADIYDSLCGDVQPKQQLKQEELTYNNQTIEQQFQALMSL